FGAGVFFAAPFFGASFLVFFAAAFPELAAGASGSASSASALAALCAASFWSLHARSKQMDLVTAPSLPGRVLMIAPNLPQAWQPSRYCASPTPSAVTGRYSAGSFSRSKNTSGTSRMVVALVSAMWASTFSFQQVLLEQRPVPILNSKSWL